MKPMRLALSPGSYKSQSSLELLITLAFGLIILLPIVVLAFIQISNSTSTLATTEAQSVASKLASIATLVGSQGAPAKQLALIQMPQYVAQIYVGTPANTIGHQIVIVVNTNAGYSYITGYSPVNVSGNLGSMESAGTYLVNISAQSSCPSDASVPCVYITPT